MWIWGASTDWLPKARLDEARVAWTSIPEELKRGRGVLRHLLVGDTDRVFGTLEEWVDRREPTLGVLFTSPLADLLRDHPRMIGVRERMGLPP